jgi:alkylation response protein AidB-like acyl-CoA dehydrogenase
LPLQTRGLKQRYVLNGRKMWITNGKEAGVFICLTLDPPPVTGNTEFIV